MLLLRHSSAVRVPSRARALLVIAALALVGGASLFAQAVRYPTSAVQHPPLSSRDIDDIAALLKLEDARQFDEAVLTRVLNAGNPEVRRRAAQTIGRLADPRGSALLMSARSDRDVNVVSSVAFAYGLLKDANAVPWLAETLMRNAPRPAVPAEFAARSLGEIRTPESRAALVKYLSTTSTRDKTFDSPVVAEALLSLGRFPPPTDLTAISRWTSVTDVEVRWRAAWALYRARDLAALPDLLRLSRDASGDVRSWAMRGLGVPAPPAPPRGGATPPTPPVPFTPMSEADRATCFKRLHEGLTDPDRRVRTEALRAIATFGDDAAFADVLSFVDNPDAWLSTSAVEAMTRFPSHADTIVPRLVAATAAGQSTAVRITALPPLTALAPDAAIALATSLLHDASTYARAQGVNALRRLGDEGRTRLNAAIAADPSIAKIAQPSPRPAIPPRTPRSDAEYRELVTRWIVPDYKGTARPHVIFGTPRGEIEIELFTGDAPFGVEYLLDVIRTGDIVGTEFGRVVPNFVDQENGIRNTNLPLRDEVSTHGLTRGNLSWASSGLDTGRPGYTLGITAQPHNEGDFTALGHIVRGMDAVDRIELGDKITSAKVK